MPRPRIQIDEENFKKLCGLQCTLSEIASFFKCSEDTIERWCKRELHVSFADAFKIHSASGKISLRRWQFKMAEHNASMLIWLGKQYLDQREPQQDVQISHDDTTVKEMMEYFTAKQKNEEETDFRSDME